MSRSRSRSADHGADMQRAWLLAGARLEAGVLSLVLAACYRGQGACVREVGGLYLEGLIASALMLANRPTTVETKETLLLTDPRF